MDPLSWEGKLKLEIHITKIRNWVWDRILKRKFIYGNRYYLLSILKRRPYENEWFAFISDCYMIKFTDIVYENKIKFELWKVN